MRLDQDKNLSNNLIAQKSWYSAFLSATEANYLGGSSYISSPYSQSQHVYKSINSISYAIAGLPFNTRVEKTRDLDSPDIIGNLLNSPNENLNQQSLIVLTFINLLLEGEAFWILQESIGERMGYSKSLPSEIYMVTPSKMKTVVDKATGAITSWKYGKQFIDVSQVIHFKLPNPYDMYRGLSPIGLIRTEMEGDAGAANYNRNFFANSARPDGIVELPADIAVDKPTIELYKEQFNEEHKGEDKAHKTSFLASGMKYTQLGISQKDMDFLEQRKFSRSQIYSLYGVPEIIAGITSASLNRATAYAQKTLFWETTIYPYLALFENTMKSQFYMKRFPDKYGVFDRSSIQEMLYSINEIADTAKTYYDMGIPLTAINNKFNLGFNEEDLKQAEVTVVDDTKNVEEAEVVVKEVEEKTYVTITDKCELDDIKDFKKEIFKQRKKVLKMYSDDSDNFIENLTEYFKENGKGILNLAILTEIKSNEGDLTDVIKGIYTKAGNKAKILKEMLKEY